MAKESGAGDGLREDDADGYEDGARSRRIGDGNLQASSFRIAIAAAETHPAFRQILAHSNFFLEAAAANAREDPRFNTSAVATGHHAFFHRAARREHLVDQGFGMRLNPN